jgi:hypothetical protein
MPSLGVIPVRILKKVTRKNETETQRGSLMGRDVRLKRISLSLSRGRALWWESEGLEISS